MATKTLLSLADYAALPDDGKRYELVEGELLELTFPNWKHSNVQALLLVELGIYLKSTPIGRVGNDFGFILSHDPDTLRGPDVFFVTNERAADIQPRGWMEGAPNLAIEVVSPSNTASEIRRKIAQYLAAGANRIWIVDPEERSARVVGSRGEETVLGEDDLLTAPDLLPGFSVSLREALDA